jgi:hypothetical protein
MNAPGFFRIWIVATSLCVIVCAIMVFVYWPAAPSPPPTGMFDDIPTVFEERWTLIIDAGAAILIISGGLLLGLLGAFWIVDGFRRGR